MAEFEVALRRAEPLRQLLAGGLGDHAWPGEVQPGAGLGDADVRERREAGDHTTGTGVHEHGDERRRRFIDEVDGAAGLGHLHETQDALLHARPSGGADRDQRQIFAGGELHAAPQLLAHDAAHAAAHEAEVHNGENALRAVNGRRAGHDRLAQSGLGLRFPHPFRIRLEVDEAEWVERRDQRPELAEGVLVGELAHALSGPDAQMVITVRAHHEIGAYLTVTGPLMT